MCSSRAIWMCIGALSFFVPATAGAELFRCVGADGTITFTDDATSCPGSEPHVPIGVVHSIPAAPPARSAPGAAASDALARKAAATQEKLWRDKKLAAETELASVEERQAYLDTFLTHCRRGGTLLRKDEAGLKHKVSCQQVDEEWASLGEREAELRLYLASGLEDECRRAGCLPGWVR